mmetsp:Transcript_10101/g.25574  ORF Transcript_10101/g.25574 Transcript_10101/m.25574 type:complete len:227 (-) Transcript_10101:777-1457(-)
MARCAATCCRSSCANARAAPSRRWNAWSATAWRTQARPGRTPSCAGLRRSARCARRRATLAGPTPAPSPTRSTSCAARSTRSSRKRCAACSSSSVATSSDSGTGSNTNTITSEEGLAAGRAPHHTIATGTAHLVKLKRSRATMIATGGARTSRRMYRSLCRRCFRESVFRALLERFEPTCIAACWPTSLAFWPSQILGPFGWCVRVVRPQRSLGPATTYKAMRHCT